MSMVRRRHIMPMVLHHRHLRDSLAVTRPAVLRNSALAGLQVALTVALVLPLVHLSPWSGLIGYAGLGALSALFGRFAETGKRTGIVVMAGLCQIASVGLVSAAAWLGATPAMLMILLACLGGCFFLIGTLARFGPPGALIFMFAGTAAMRAPDSLDDLLARIAMTAAAAGVAVLLCALTESFRFKGHAERPLPQEPLRTLKDLMPTAIRICAGAAIAGFVAMAMGMEHAGWAALGATAVLQGPFLHLSIHRALQRVAGTIIGSLAVWLILQGGPGTWEVIALIVVLQIATEVVIGFNYGFGQIFVTPMALLMTYLAASGTAGPDLAGERVIDTLIGALVGIVVAIILSTQSDRMHLSERHASVGR